MFRRPSNSRSCEVFPVSRRDRKPRAWPLILLMLFVPPLIAGGFFGAEAAQRYGLYSSIRAGTTPDRIVRKREVIRDMDVDRAIRIARIQHPASLDHTDISIYDLRVEPEDWLRLEAQAKMVLATMFSDRVTLTYVPAQFLDCGQWINVRVRLRGYYKFNHFQPASMSLRIRFPREHLFRGKRQINLVQIFDKGLTADLVLNNEMGRSGGVR